MASESDLFHKSTRRTTSCHVMPLNTFICYLNAPFRQLKQTESWHTSILSSYSTFPILAHHVRHHQSHHRQRDKSEENRQEHLKLLHQGRVSHVIGSKPREQVYGSLPWETHECTIAMTLVCLNLVFRYSLCLWAWERKIPDRRWICR